MRKYLMTAYGVLFFTACKQKQAAEPQPVSREVQVGLNINSLKKEAIIGDLVVRLGDDLLSYQIKFLNEKDQSWSHAGVVVEKAGQKWIAHISPDEGERKGIQYVPVDSFLNPAKTLACGLFRYNFTPSERDSFAAVVESYKSLEIPFDRLYDLDTDEEMYCSELIGKAVRRATGGRIKFRAVNVAQNMRTAVYHHFKKELSKQTIAERKIMTIDNLYRVPECSPVMQFPLKFFPGK